MRPVHTLIFHLFSKFQKIQHVTWWVNKNKKRLSGVKYLANWMQRLNSDRRERAHVLILGREPWLLGPQGPQGYSEDWLAGERKQ